MTPHQEIIFLSVAIVLVSAILIEGVIKGRFLGGSGCSRAKSPVFYYLHVALLAYVIFRFVLFLQELIPTSP